MQSGCVQDKALLSISVRNMTYTHTFSITWRQEFKKKKKKGKGKGKGRDTTPKITVPLSQSPDCTLYVFCGISPGKWSYMIC